MTEENTKTLVSAGPHLARIDKEGLTESPGEKKSLQVGLGFTFIDDNDPDCGRMVTWYGTLASDAAYKYSVNQLRNAGWEGNDFENIGVVGNQCIVVIEHEEWEGEVRAKVKWVNSLGGNFTPLDGEQKKNAVMELNERLKMSGLAKVPQNKPAPQGVDEEDDDDIGF